MEVLGGNTGVDLQQGQIQVGHQLVDPAGFPLLTLDVRVVNPEPFAGAFDFQLDAPHHVLGDGGMSPWAATSW